MKKNQNNTPIIKNGAMLQSRFVRIVFGALKETRDECDSSFSASPVSRKLCTVKGVNPFVTFPSASVP